MVMFGMLTKWERKILLDKLHGVEVNPDHLRAVKHRAKKRLIQAMRDLHLLLAVFPDLAVTGVTSLFSVPSLMPSQEAFVRFLVVFGEALIIPFIIASLGFVVAIPRQSHLSRPSAVLPEEFEERYGIPGIPRQEESYNIGFMEKMYCRYCGRSIPADSLYCQYCGRRLR